MLHIIIINILLNLKTVDIYIFNLLAVQNERDRISCRRPSYEENNQNNGLSVGSLLNAEMLSRQVGAALEVGVQ